MFIEFTHWLPDNETTDQGVLVDIENIIPTNRGFASTPGSSFAFTEALAADCRGFSTETTLANAKVTFAGTATKLYKKSSATWAEVTRASGNYALGTADRWRFVTQGNVTLAVSGRANAGQKYAHATDSAFADVAAMPKSELVEAIGRHVLVANYNISSDIIDGWGCSKIDDYTNWTASVDDQCVFGRLVDTPGPITGLKRLADYAIFYKQNSMYLCRYVGVPEVFSFALVSDNVGAVTQEAIVRVGRVHYFVGTDNIYSFDSATLLPIGDQIRDWFNKRCNNAARDRIVSTRDQQRSIIYWFFPAGSSTTCNEYIAYNYVNGKWGRGVLAVQAANEYAMDALTYNNLDGLLTTYAAYDDLTYEELSYSQNTGVPAIIGTDKKLTTLTGASGDSYIVTGDFGVDSAFTLLQRIRPRFYVDPESAVWKGFFRENMKNANSEGSSVTLSDGKFDYLKTSRWHSGKCDFTGTMELVGLDVSFKEQGRE